MTPIIFSILCLTVAGADDCSFEWHILPLDEIKVLYSEHKEPHESLGGFQFENKIYAANIEILIHEIEHLKCSIEYSDPTELELCNFGVDARDYLAQATHDINPTPDAPLITERMAFQELIFSNQVIQK